MICWPKMMLTVSVGALWLGVFLLIYCAMLFFLPNTLGPIIVASAFIVPAAIIQEAVLSYLGVGVRPDVSPDTPFPSSWGQMIDSREAIRQRLRDTFVARAAYLRLLRESGRATAST